MHQSTATFFLPGRGRRRWWCWRQRSQTVRARTALARILLLAPIAFLMIPGAAVAVSMPTAKREAAGTMPTNRGPVPLLAADETAGVLEPVPPMLHPRAAHTATRLTDGRVLIAGGCVADSCELGPASAATELFDPATGAFTPGPAMSEQRVSHVAILLADGRVLIAGGWGPGRPLASADLYDPVTDTITPTGPMATPRADPVIALLPDGGVLIAGGDDGDRPLASAERFDPETGLFSPAGTMYDARSSHVLAPLPDGRLLIAGGMGDGERLLAGAERYDPNTGVFSRTGDLATARFKHAAAVLGDGGVLVAGGASGQSAADSLRSAERYDPVTGVFSPAGEMTFARYKFAAAVATLADGGVLLAGGAPTLETFHSDAGFAPISGSLPAALSFSTATVLDDGRVLITGGYDDRIMPTASAWLYDPGA